MGYNELYQDCDDVLNYIMQHGGAVNISDAARVVSKIGGRFHAAIQQLVADKAIERRQKNPAYLDIRPEGRAIQAMGGYKVYLQRQSIKEAEGNERIRKQDQKSDLEIQALMDTVVDYPKTKSRANWSYWMSWITLLIAILSLIVSIVRKG